MNTKQLVYLFAALWTAVVLSSCSETDDSQAEFEDWQARNEAYYKEIYTRAKANADGTWRVLHNWSYNDGVATAPPITLQSRCSRPAQGRVVRCIAILPA